MEASSPSSSVLVELRIELPAHGHSFTLSVPSSSSIEDVKKEIHKHLTGAPRVDGQRVIWRGRYLKDNEKVDEIWTSNEEPRIVHLAVNPSAWTSAPPSSSSAPPQEEQEPTAVAPIPAPGPALLPDFSLPQNYQNHPMSYILQLHQRAASVLTNTTKEKVEENGDGRKAAVDLLQELGYTWPEILDAPYPLSNENENALYSTVIIKNQTFLQLNAEVPQELTESQTHALHVLSYTCTMLTLPYSSPSSTLNSTPTGFESWASPPPATQYYQIPPHLTALLQQHANNLHNNNNNGNGNIVMVGGAPPGVGRNPVNEPAAAELRQLRLQMFILPLFMLLLRTGLLLYFIAPARKPVFAVLIFAWVVYEIWQPIRNAIARRQELEAGAANRNAGVNGNGNGQLNDQADGRPGVLVGPPELQGQFRPAGAQAANTALAMVENLGNLHVQAEENVLNGHIDDNGREGGEPRWKERAWVFMALLFVSAHPGMWNRRRRTLRERENRIRADASIRDEVPPPPPSEEQGEEGQEREAQTPENEARTKRRNELIEQHRRRPDWVKEYMERVVHANWVDEAD